MFPEETFAQRIILIHVLQAQHEDRVRLAADAIGLDDCGLLRDHVKELPHELFAVAFEFDGNDGFQAPASFGGREKRNDAFYDADVFQTPHTA